MLAAELTSNLARALNLFSMRRMARFMQLELVKDRRVARTAHRGSSHGRPHGGLPMVNTRDLPSETELRSEAATAAMTRP